MTQAIEDIGSLPDRKVHDQEMQVIGKVTHVYAIDGDGVPVWVCVRGSFGLFNKQDVIVPLARLKEEDGELVVPYSIEHMRATPEVEGDEIDEAMDRKLRDHFSIDAADQELRADNAGYATLIPNEPVTTKKVEDPSSLETPDADRRDDETYQRLHDPGSAEAREIDAGAIANEATSKQGNSGPQDEGGAADESSGDGEDGEDTSAERPADEPSAEAESARERSGG
jgi:hypothetical protein